MTLEEVKDLIYKKKKETTIKMRMIRAKSDYEDFDLDKALLEEYDKYKDYIREVTPMIRDIELNNIMSNIFRIEPIEDWTKGRYSRHSWLNRFYIFDKYKDDTIMTTIIKERCYNLKNEYKEREF